MGPPEMVNQWTADMPRSGFASTFFFYDTAPTDIYTLSLHDALPIWLLTPHFLRGLDDEPELGHLLVERERVALHRRGEPALRREAKLLQRNVFGRLVDAPLEGVLGDRKSTRLNSSHVEISYAVFCLK